MRSFLLHNGKPTIKWSMQKPNTFFEGNLPSGFDLAIVPEEYVVIDVDVKSGKNGFEHIPMKIQVELDKTFFYNTASGGRHYFLSYSGNKELINRATKEGIDIRCGSKGYVKYKGLVDIRECVSLIKTSSPKMNAWIEKLFS